MKIKLLSLGILVISLSNTLFSQDIIYLKDGSELKAKIIELTSEFVKYKKFEQLEGPVRNLSISDLFMIIYQDGTREVFKKENTDENQLQLPVESNNKKEDITINSLFDNQELCFKGQQDAERYYTGYRQAATWTAATTILGGAIIGLIPAIACSSSEPQMSSVTVPNSKLFENSTYYHCYKQEAKRIKSRKVWTNFGIGVAIDLAIAILIISASSGQ